MTLTIRDLFAAPTVSEMAKLLDGNERQAPESYVDLANVSIDVHVLIYINGLFQQVETHDVKDSVYVAHH